MKISDEEINAANYQITRYEEGRGNIQAVKEALEAAYTVRKQRKAAKRKRQRKEKDEQVVESVKALEWDGKFGIGEWEMRDGQKQVIYEIDPNGGIYPLNAVNGLTYTKHGENFESEERQSDLIRPWPKGEQ